ncbi:hypothetical protein V5799_022370 [Amblyomma americanum]|uniref:Alcohol dehydrogenase transcription factor myb/sant-like protein n=1 Tax=Amblyomma americanum TaxID=6943 RepID=A0AAQ4FKN4_AMBAM
MMSTSWLKCACNFSRYNCAESVDLVQKRWKSLRDKFRRLYTARQLGRKSGAGADDIEPTDFVWAHYEQLLFLRDTMVTRPTSGNYRQQLREPGPNVVPGASSTPAYQHNSAPEPSETIIELEEWRLDCASQASLVHEVVTDEPLPSRHESLPSRHESPASSQSVPSLQAPVGLLEQEASVLQSSAPRQNKRKRRRECADDALVEHVGKLADALQTCDGHDEYDQFCLSMAKMMKRVNKNQQIDLRVKLLQVFNEFTSE